MLAVPATATGGPTNAKARMALVKAAMNFRLRPHVTVRTALISVVPMPMNLPHTSR